MQWRYCMIKYNKVVRKGKTKTWVCVVEQGIRLCVEPASLHCAKLLASRPPFYACSGYI